MKTSVVISVTLFLAPLALGGSKVTDADTRNRSQKGGEVEERLVFVTGSLIPQRIQVRRVGTATTSPLRVIDRREIDQTGRLTTPGALINEPSLRLINFH